MVEKIDQYTVKVMFEKPTPFWADRLRRHARHDHPQASVRRLHRRQVARCADQPQAGRHRPLHVQGLQAGRHGVGRDQPELPHGEPALFRRHRDEGRRRRRLGGARRAADRRVRLRLEHAGRGRDPRCAWRRAARARSSSRRAATSSTSSSTPPIRGPRSTASARASRPSIRRSAIRRCARRSSLLVDKDSVEKFIYGRTGNATANFVNNPEKFRSKNTKFEFNVDKANDILEKAGWKKGADGIREKDGKKLKFVYQTSINQPRQKTQAIVKQACQKAGIDIEVKAVTASVFFSSDVANPDTYTKFYCDLQMYTTTMTQPDPGAVHEAVPVGGGGHQGRTSGRAATSRAGGTRSTTTSTRPRQVELDPVKRAAMFIKAERHGDQRPGRDPGRRPPRRRSAWPTSSWPT